MQLISFGPVSNAIRKQIWEARWFKGRYVRRPGASRRERGALRLRNVLMGSIAISAALATTLGSAQADAWIKPLCTVFNFCSATSVQLQIGARVWREPESLLLPFPLGFFPYPTKRARQVFGVPYNSTVECSTKSKNDFLALRASDGLLVGPLTPAKDEGSQQFTTVVTGYLEVTFDNMRDSSFDVEVAYGRDNKITTDEDEYLIHVDVKDRSGECYIPFLISGNLSYRNFWPPHKETYDAYNWEKGNYVVKIILTNGISGSTTTEFSVK